MPGRRNFARERTQHATDAPGRQARISADLRTHLPDHDRALVGHAAILAYLHRLGIRRLRGTALTIRIVDRWRTHHNCPILRGYHDTRVSASPLTTTHALTAWLLARFTAADLFKVVDSTQDSQQSGSSPKIRVPPTKAA